MSLKLTHIDWTWECLAFCEHRKSVVEGGNVVLWSLFTKVARFVALLKG